MYQKSTLLFFALLCMGVPCTACVKPWLEVKPSYFFFSACPMKDIYHRGAFEVQGSASVPLCRYLDFYGSVGYREAWGHAFNTCEKTKLIVIPCDIGLKPVFNFCERFSCSFAVGPRFFYFHQHNDSPYVDCKINSGGVGLFVNTGFSVLLRDHFLLGIFAEYSYEKKSICPHKENVFSNDKVQIGGVACGISLGYAF